jgi:hypothetical protein
MFLSGFSLKEEKLLNVKLISLKEGFGSLNLVLSKQFIWNWKDRSKFFHLAVTLTLMVIVLEYFDVTIESYFIQAGLRFFFFQITTLQNLLFLESSFSFPETYHFFCNQKGKFSTTHKH